MKTLVCSFLAVLSLSAALGAQPPAKPVIPDGGPSQAVTPDDTKAVIPAPAPPVLTEVQKLQLQNAAKDVELWQLRAQQAAGEYEKSRGALQQLIAAVTPPGYQLTDKLELVKIPPPSPPAAATPEKKQPGA